MINKLLVDNFKLFKEKIEIPLNKINVLTGINGRGKSTALQIFLLLSQSVLDNRATNKVLLNGVNVRLGSFDDVKNKEVSFSNQVHFGFSYDDFIIDYYLHHQQADATELLIEKIEAKGKMGTEEFELSLVREDNLYNLTKVKSVGTDYSFKSPLFDLFLSEASLVQYDHNTDCAFIRNALNLIDVHYVSADRIGPKNYYENKSLGRFVSVGSLGENTVNLLHHKGLEKVNPIILQGYADLFDKILIDLSVTIGDNTNYWLSEIFQGAQVLVEPIKGEDLLKLRINSDGGASYFKPTNVGYGFSYSLPIIVAGLTAKEGELLIIENPEAHLHPHAQSILAKFLSLISKTGVQVLIESHSEHILNGLRVAIKDQIISNSELNVLYFDKNAEKLFTKVDVDKDGGISNWPPDFFDQSTKDLNYLFGI